MSTSSNVTEKDLTNLRKLGEQQKNQRAEKIENRILKKDIKLAESVSPITEKLGQVKKSTQELGDVIKKSKPQIPQLAIENTPTTHQPIENNEGSIYDVELEDTLKNIEKDTTRFLKHIMILNVDGFWIFIQIKRQVELK